MAVRLITYDLNNEIRRPPITAKIKELFPNWAKLSESSYAVQTELSAKQVYQSLLPMLDGDDSCIVVTLSSEFWGYSRHPDVIPWLQGYL